VFLHFLIASVSICCSSDAATAHCDALPLSSAVIGCLELELGILEGNGSARRLWLLKLVLVSAVDQDVVGHVPFLSGYLMRFVARAGASSRCGSTLARYGSQSVRGLLPLGQGGLAGSSSSANCQTGGCLLRIRSLTAHETLQLLEIFNIADLVLFLISSWPVRTCMTQSIELLHDHAFFAQHAVVPLVSCSYRRPSVLSVIRFLL